MQGGVRNGPRHEGAAGVRTAVRSGAAWWAPRGSGRGGAGEVACPHGRKPLRHVIRLGGVRGNRQQKGLGHLGQELQGNLHGLQNAVPL